MKSENDHHKQGLSINSLKNFWTIAKLYWLGGEKFTALSLLLLLLLLLMLSTWLSVVLNTQQGVIISTLAAKKSSQFWNSLLILMIILAIYVPLIGGYNYISGQLGNYWRRWLTHYLLSKYLENRNFYNCVNNSEIDNPDQRIAEDIKNFTQNSLGFLLLIVGYVLQLLGFGVALWQIHKPLLFAIIIYSLSGTILTVFIFSKPLVALRFEQIKKEANFRFGLIRIRDNAESIAFYQGENQELYNSSALFKEVFDNFNSILNWQFFLDILAKAFAFIPYIIPPLVLANPVFSGQLEVGKVSEAVGAFIAVFTALGFLVDQFQSLTTFGAGVERLYTFFYTMKNPDELMDNYPPNCQIVQTIHPDHLAVKNLTLLTPNSRKTLFRDLSLELHPEVGLLIIGASGCGKSSLLRAIAGLWTNGTGEIVRPALKNMLFLPQRPYMTLGSLRSQILYPNTDLDVSYEYLKNVLHQVNLPDLAEKLDNLDIEEISTSFLSIGEQQRLAFARLLVSKPKYAILDESTSALDVVNESHLYNHLLNLGTTYISVGHRPSLEQYHSLVLEILGNGEWKLRDPISSN